MTGARLVGAACAVSGALGFFFLFVWSPLPWGWEGIDHYHDRALQLLAGRGFRTTDVPWAYPYYLTAFYWIFGPTPWVPLVGQVLLNATVPWLLYLLARRLTGHRIAIISALLVGVLSFNTVYASTQSTDSVCTVLFLLSLVLLESGIRLDSLGRLGMSGLAIGLAMQFRPNLTLFPLVAAAMLLLLRGVRWRTTVLTTAYLACALAVLAPWIVRNYLLTGAFVPTSTHGGIQLWYGSLQTGPYLEEWTRNPRSAFAPAAFPYTSLTGETIIIEAAGPSCAGADVRQVSLVYWTSHDSTRRALQAAEQRHDRLVFTVPAQPDGTRLAFYFEAASTNEQPPARTPADGDARPFVLFIAKDHLADLDRDEDFIDIFDLVEQIREPMPGGPDRRPDIFATAAAVAAGAAKQLDPAAMDLAITTEGAELRLPDEASLFVPRAYARITDLVAQGENARALLYGSVRRQPPDLDVTCAQARLIGANDVFYRRELHLQDRYVTLALDNIRAAPLSYAASVAYRAVRLFVIRGSDNRNSVQQFGGSGFVYGAGAALSALYFVAFLAGVGVAFRRCRAALLLLVPILYVPATISFVLTNMRYTITVQPYVFVFVALALIAAIDWLRVSRSTLRA